MQYRQVIMKRICPMPDPWNQAYERLTKFAQFNPCAPPLPPRPLILAGWVFSNDIDKMQVWEETVDWAVQNGCANLVTDIPDSDFYYVECPSNYAVGPYGNPYYLTWNSEAKSRPSSEQIEHLIDYMLSHWSEIVGNDLASITRPLAFTGRKARRLLVLANADTTPPWGGWASRSANESERRTFTKFRASINKAIAPHEVDHIDFTTQ